MLGRKVGVASTPPLCVPPRYFEETLEARKIIIV